MLKDILESTKKNLKRKSKLIIINNENSIAVTKLTSFYTEGEVLKGVTRK